MADFSAIFLFMDKSLLQKIWDATALIDIKGKTYTKAAFERKNKKNKSLGSNSSYYSFRI